jgi:pimeloyl-ACP methyl ester carboxylesterase
VLGGLSFGGLASLHLTLARPQRSRGLLLVASGPGFKKPAAQARWEAMVERTASFVERKGMAAFVESRASQTTIGARPELPAAKAAGRAIAAQTPHGIAHFARRVAAPARPVIDQLPKIQVPTLIVVGEEDEAYRRAGELMEARIDAAERVVIPGAGHIVNLEDADAFNAVVVRFLGRLTGAA